jgi:hypothetical protein
LPLIFQIFSLTTGVDASRDGHDLPEGVDTPEDDGFYEYVKVVFDSRASWDEAASSKRFWEPNDSYNFSF